MKTATPRFILPHKRKLLLCRLEVGADINARGYEGRTALHNTVDSENIELARLLLNHGANKDARDN